MFCFSENLEHQAQAAAFEYTMNPSVVKVNEQKKVIVVFKNLIYAELLDHGWPDAR